MAGYEEAEELISGCSGVKTGCCSVISVCGATECYVIQNMDMARMGVVMKVKISKQMLKIETYSGSLPSFLAMATSRWNM